jgi:hypothetical protein
VARQSKKNNIEELVIVGMVAALRSDPDPKIQLEHGLWVSTLAFELIQQL